MSTNNLLTLAARIRAELADLKQAVQRAERLLAKSETAKDEDYLDGVALNLHGFYSGAERIFEEIAREVDGSVPSSREWYRDLLLQMSVEVAGRRPLVVEHSTRNCLDEFRGFRHGVRNVYTFNLRPSRLRELGVDLPHCYASLVKDLTTFCNFLEQISSSDDS